MATKSKSIGAGWSIIVQHQSVSQLVSRPNNDFRLYFFLVQVSKSISSLTKLQQNIKWTVIYAFYQYIPHASYIYGKWGGFSFVFAQ